MTITFSESNLIGDPGVIPGDLAIPPTSFLTSFYGNLNFGLDVTLAKASDGEATYTVNSVTYNTSANTFFLSAVAVSNNTIRISKVESPFTTESYDYRLSGSNEVLEYTIEEVDDLPPVFGMTKWNYPNDPKYVIVNHSITVSGVSNSLQPFTETTTIPQYFYWKLQPALDQFKTLVDREYP